MGKWEGESVTGREIRNARMVQRQLTKRREPPPKACFQEEEMVVYQDTETR